MWNCIFLKAKFPIQVQKNNLSSYYELGNHTNAAKDKS